MKKIYFYTLLLGLLAFTACEDEKSPVMELQKASAFEPFSQATLLSTMKMLRLSFLRLSGRRRTME